MEFQDRWSNVNQCIFIVLKINKDIRTLIVLHIIIFLLLMNFCSAMFPTYILQKLSNQIFDTHLPIYQYIFFQPISKWVYTYTTLEIKPCGLGSRVWDMEAELRLKGITDLISWWIFGKLNWRCGMNGTLSLSTKVCAEIRCF